MFIAYLSQFILEFGKCARILTFIGKNSIYLYCVHAMDYIYGVIWNRANNNMVSGLIRASLDVLICVILIRAMESSISLLSVYGVQKDNNRKY